MTSFRVVLDACVLFPASLRDTLLRAAGIDLYRIQLTEQILEEVKRSLIRKNISADKVQGLVNKIQQAFPNALVSEKRYKPLVETMLNHEGDRHVLAAAVACEAQVIVTQNLKHFPADVLGKYDIEAQSPDQFLVHLFDLDHYGMVKVISEQASSLRNPPKTVLELLDTLYQHAPRFVDLFRQKVSRDM